MTHRLIYFGSDSPYMYGCCPQYKVQATLEICGAENGSCRQQHDSFFSRSPSVFLCCDFKSTKVEKKGNKVDSHERIIKAGVREPEQKKMGSKKGTIYLRNGLYLG